MAKNHKYPKAGKNAPAGVKAEIKKFHKMPDAYKNRLNLWQHLLGSGTQPYKMDPDDSAYVEKSSVPGQTCGNCIYWFVNPVGDRKVCAIISGDDVKKKGWCRLWEGVPKK